MPYINIFRVPHLYTLTAGTTSAQKTIVFIHGWLLSQCYWQPVIQHLKDDFQCVSYDLRGFGGSNAHLTQRDCGTTDGLQTETAYSLAAYAQDLGVLLESLDLKEVWLIGHSLGGSVALWAAKLFPHRIEGVICVNAGGGVYLPKEFKRFRQAGQQIVRWRPAWLAAMPLLAYAFARLMVFKPVALKWGEQRVADWLAAHEDAAMGSLLESTTEAEVHRLPQVVASLQQPAYFIAGARDTVMEEKYVRHLASFHTLFEEPDSNVAVLPECGHMAMLEQPIALAQTIQAILGSGTLSSQPFPQFALSQEGDG
ncbi:MAG: alpha/beta hydrolase [Leptolyngbya sp. SIO1E4]|nr:alpha/beta hydrolase [Leptolyngbya sp. SIO1E4]